MATNLGIKYQTYIDDKLVILRLIKIKEGGKKLVFLNQNREKIYLTDEEFHSRSYVQLIPDAFMVIMHTKFKDGEDDVYVCINKNIENETKPSLIMRQNAMMNMEDLDNFNPYNMNIFVGTYWLTGGLTDDEIKSVLDFDHIEKEKTVSFALYVDDTMRDIELVLESNTKRIDNILKKLQEKHENTAVKGYTDSIQSFLRQLNFINLYRAVFNIHQVLFPIDLGDNITEDGLVRLNHKQIEELEKLIAWKITNITVIKYAKDIDISKLISNSHIMISDSQQIIYLVTYTAIAPLSDQNKDVVQAMNHFRK